MSVPLQPLRSNPCNGCANANRVNLYVRVPGYVGMFVCDECAKELAELLRGWLNVKRQDTAQRLRGSNDLT